MPAVLPESSVGIESGFKVRTDARSWRLGLEFHDGRSWVSEFLQDEGCYVSLGLWVDL